MRVVLCLLSSVLATAVLPTAMAAQNGNRADSGNAAIHLSSWIPVHRSTAASLGRSVRVDVSRASVSEALQQIADHAGLELAYGQEVRAARHRVSLRAEHTTLGDALATVLEGTGLEAYVTRQGDALLVRRADPPEPVKEPRAATGTIIGRVTDASTGDAIPTADVAIEETEQRATTDAEGLYRLEDVPLGSYTLTASRLGYTDATRNVTIAADEEVRADFALEVAPSEVEEIVVTGSRIRRAQVDGPSPVTILTRQDLDRSGRATVAEALAQLPQNSASPVSVGGASGTKAGIQAVNLRGLGQDNTLVLVNGRRVTSSGAQGYSPPVDLNSIPIAAVERIEVLKDGASALYGSDAVAGVVNIILKKDFVGTEISFNSGFSLEGGAREMSSSFVTGWSGGGFNVLIGGEYFDRKRLRPKERSFSKTDDLRARGGRDHRVDTANPGNVCSVDGENCQGWKHPVPESRPVRTGATWRRKISQPPPANSISKTLLARTTWCRRVRGSR